MLPLETRKEIAREYADGVKVKVIAITYGVSESTPARIAAALGIAPRRPNHRKVSDAMKQELADFYKGTKKPMKIICAKLGISESCASKVLQGMGVKKFIAEKFGICDRAVYNILKRNDIHSYGSDNKKRSRN